MYIFEIQKKMVCNLNIYIKCFVIYVIYYLYYYMYILIIKYKKNKNIILIIFF